MKTPFSSRPSLRPLLLLLLPLALAGTARAEYVVTITGGSWLSTGDFPDAAQADATQGSASLVGGCPTGGDDDSDHSVMPAGEGTADCSGTMSVHLHWNGDPDARPHCLVVRETAGASWTGDPGGSCSTGLPNETVSNLAHGQNKNAVRYTVVTDPAVDLYLSDAPTADASFDGGGGGDGPGTAGTKGGRTNDPSLIAGTADVSYTVEVGPITIDLSGGIPDDGSRRYLVGQRCVASLSLAFGATVVAPPAPSTAPKETWSASEADPFKVFDVATDPSVPSSHGHRVDLADADEHLATLTCCFAKAGTATVTVAAHIRLPDGSEVDVGTEKDASVSRPTVTPPTVPMVSRWSCPVATSSWWTPTATRTISRARSGARG